MDSSSTVLCESQQLRKNVSQVMRDVIKKQTDMHQSASEALQKKITETNRLEVCDYSAERKGILRINVYPIEYCRMNLNKVKSMKICTI